MNNKRNNFNNFGIFLVKLRHDTTLTRLKRFGILYSAPERQIDFKSVDLSGQTNRMRDLLLKIKQ